MISSERKKEIEKVRRVCMRAIQVVDNPYGGPMSQGRADATREAMSQRLKLNLTGEEAMWMDDGWPMDAFYMTYSLYCIEGLIEPLEVNDDSDKG